MDTLRLLSKIFLAIGSLSLIFVAGVAWLTFEVSGDSPLRYLGLVFFIIPVAFIGVALRVRRIVKERDETVAWLREFGQRVTAEVLNMTTSYVKHSGRMIIHLTARWQREGDEKPWVFSSGAINRASAPKVEKGDEVIILVDPNDPNRYVFELSMEARCEG